MKYLVQINYKSGNSIELWFENFSVTNSSDGEITQLKWKLAEKPGVGILHIGCLNDIESVFQLEAKQEQ